MSIKKLIFAGLLSAVVLLAGCNLTTQSGGGSGSSAGEYKYESIGDRSKNLDFIFSTGSVGTVTITMNRSEWNQMLTNFDYFYKNENCVKFEKFEYSKGGKTWNLEKGGGIRLRGNTSRFRPQGKDYKTDKFGNTKMNYGWSQGYYAYAANCSDDDYRQAHFKVDFEEFLEDGDEQKLAGCMKGVALKRMDGSCTKEIFCYDLFHRYGIWTAPRASHTRVFFNFIEPDGSVTKVNFGVYEMFEEVNKQSLKARDNDENSAVNAWKNSKGNLWKCSGGDLTNPYSTMDCEKNEITEFAEDGTPLNYVWYQPTYDLKTNKEGAAKEAAITEFRNFITELNALPDIINDEDTENIRQVKSFYEKWFDVKFFLKTYAVNILVGMDDDYWANANNYYLYFADTPSDGRKVYFIPFDYDNTIGASIQGKKSEGTPVGIEQNPLEWGRGKNRPLMDKLVQVPEYRELFKTLLKEVSARDSEWNYEKCSARWYNYWAMVQPYLWSNDLNGNVSTMWCGNMCYNDFKTGPKSLVDKNNNIYDYTRECILANLKKNSGGKITFDLNGGNIDGSTASVEVTYSAGKIFDLADLIKTPKRSGYAFMGWTQTKNGNDYVSTASVSKVYARWKSYSEIKNLYIYELEPGMDGYDKDYKGIQIKILNPPSAYSEKGNPEGARVRQIYVNDVKVSDISNNESVMKAERWTFPYVEKENTYKIYVKYLKSNYYTQHSVSNVCSITASSGTGKFSVETKSVGFTAKDNVISFDPQPEIYVAGKKISSDYKPGYYQITFHDPDWIYSVYPKIKDYKLDSFNVFDWYLDNASWALDYAVALSVQTSMIYVVKNTDDDSGDYRLDINLSGNDFKLTDTRTKAEVLPEDESRPGVVLKFPVSEFPEETYIRRIRLDGILISDIRSYSTHEKDLVWSEEWYWPYVAPGKQYTFSVEYLNSNWKTILKLPDIKVTPKSGNGEFKIVQKPEYTVKDNVIEWTKQPVISLGGSKLTQEDFAAINAEGNNLGYKVALDTTGWGWCFDKYEYSSELESFNLLDYCKNNSSSKVEQALSNTCFIYLELIYGHNSDSIYFPYGRYEYEILSDTSKMNFTLSE